MKKRIFILACVAVFSMAVTSIFFYIFERGHNPTITNAWDVIWWWIVTSATVGYGDVVPQTTGGKVTAIVAILSGFFVFANTIAIVAEVSYKFMDRHSLGTAKLRLSDHVVVCDYTAVADEIIQALPHSTALCDRDLVIVTELVTRNPYPEHSFVFGVPISPAVLTRARVEKADYVFVFANLRFADPDVKTMHVAARVIRMNPQATVFVELIDPDNDLLQHAPKELVVLESREIIKMILQGKPIDPGPWLNEHLEKESASSKQEHTRPTKGTSP